MRISDWSSDVCSSDLETIRRGWARSCGRPHKGRNAEPRHMAPSGRDRRDGDGGDGRGAAAGRLLFHARYARAARKSVVYGKSVSVRVDLGGRRIINNKNNIKNKKKHTITNK